MVVENLKFVVFLTYFIFYYNVIPVKITDNIYAIDIPNNINDMFEILYFTGVSSVDDKNA